MIRGVLHLLGMDHHEPEDRRNMRAIERHLRWQIEELGL